MPTDTFPCVRVEGSILPPDLLQRVAAVDAKLPGLRVEDYGLVGEKVNEATSHAWTRLTAAWAGGSRPLTTRSRRPTPATS